MLYQKMLLGEKPYFISFGRRLCSFENHRHPEIEFSYCVSGSYPVMINNKTHILKRGDLAIIGSMVAHEFPKNDGENCNSLVIEAGPVLLTEYFDLLTRITARSPIIKVDEENNRELFDLFQELIEVRKRNLQFSELTIKGNIYKICAYILREYESLNLSEQKVHEIHSVANIEKALELIYKDYSTHLTVEDAAQLCGYGKSNFCKIFKRVTGDTFHNVLNKHRVEIACDLLDKTNSSVETIAYETGFAETKTFCRIFKSIKGITAGEYRKKNAHR